MPERPSYSPTNLFRWLLRHKMPPASSYRLPSSQLILSSRDKFPESYPRQLQHDTPLATIYRLYVAIFGGRQLTLRNEIECF